MESILRKVGATPDGYKDVKPEIVAYWQICLRIAK